DVGDVGRELHDHGKRRRGADRSGDARRGLRVDAELHAPLRRVGAGDVQLDRVHTGAVEAPRQRREVIIRLAEDVGDDRGVVTPQLRQLVADERLHTDVLQADRVEHAAGRLRDAAGGVPLARLPGQTLRDDPPEARDVEVRQEVETVPGGAAGGQDRVL